MLSNRFLNVYQAYGRKFAEDLSTDIIHAVVSEVNKSKKLSPLKRYELIGYFMANQINVRQVGDDLLVAEK